MLECACGRERRDAGAKVLHALGVIFFLINKRFCLVKNDYILVFYKKGGLRCLCAMPALLSGVHGDEEQGVGQYDDDGGYGRNASALDQQHGREVARATDGDHDARYR